MDEPAHTQDENQSMTEYLHSSSEGNPEQEDDLLAEVEQERLETTTTTSMLMEASAASDRELSLSRRTLLSSAASCSSNTSWMLKKQQQEALKNKDDEEDESLDETKGSSGSFQDDGNEDAAAVPPTEFYREQVSTYWQDEFDRRSRNGRDVPLQAQATVTAFNGANVRDDEKAIPITPDTTFVKRTPTTTVSSSGQQRQRNLPATRAKSMSDKTEEQEASKPPAAQRAQSMPVRELRPEGSNTPPSYRRRCSQYWEQEFHRRSITDREHLQLLDIMEDEAEADAMAKEKEREKALISEGAVKKEPAAKIHDKANHKTPISEDVIKGRECSALARRTCSADRERQEEAKAILVDSTMTPPIRRVDDTGVIRTVSVLPTNELEDLEPATSNTLSSYQTETPNQTDLDRATSQPGAFAAQGRACFSTARGNRRREESNEIQATASGGSDQHPEEYEEPLSGSFNEARRRPEDRQPSRPDSLESGVVINASVRLSTTSALGGGRSSLDLTASIVDDAEAIYEAKDVRQDNFFRNIIVWIIAGAISCVLIITLSVVLTRNDDLHGEMGGDPLCWPPVDDQSVAVRCFCSNSTSGFFDSMTEDQQYAYMRQQMFLQSQGIISNDTEIDVDGCDMLNQDLLIMANMTSEMESTTELFNRGSDAFRLSMAAFVRLYTSMGGLHWTKSANWLDPEVCVWDGVTCLFVDVVYKFILTENNLHGSLPAALIGSLDSLRMLDLSMNAGIVGTIPTEIAGMRSLQSLAISHTSLSGTIPTELATMDRLDAIVLNKNKLSGTIPIEITNLGATLRSLELSSNMINGTIPFEIGKLSRLTGLLLGGNQFTGSLPSEMARLTHLELLSIGFNQFQGSIPDFLGSMPRLEMIYLYNSGLTGNVPETFCSNSTIPRRIVVMCETTGLCSCCSTTDPNAMVKMDCYEDMQPGDTPWLDL